ncbi:hypothetical protein IFM89_023925 [Coptis chinensis]|uniref:Uncharacterized protein n=1 Tax=Coptis chinensis TaxID=261450 RepID=A0A835I560_9MAGN|nr:hypothetical protein IFM89_023925 [Coptis chinensis]
MPLQMSLTMILFRKYGDGGNGRDLGLKRQRIIDQPPSFYGAPPGSSFMCSASPPPPPSYAYSAQPPPPFLLSDCADSPLIALNQISLSSSVVLT